MLGNSCIISKIATSVVDFSSSRLVKNVSQFSEKFNPLLGCNKSKSAFICNKNRDTQSCKGRRFTYYMYI